MTKRDFFILVIKLFGLMSIVTSLFSVIPSNISFALMDIDIFSLIWITVAVIVVIGLFVLLVFKADKVVELLRLDKGFDDEKIELGSLNSSDIVKIGTFIIGGLLILDNIPGFLSHTLFAFKGSVIGQVYDSKDKFYLTVSGINIILGYLLLTNYSFVVRLLRTENKKNE
jgi:hypothetical protein